MSAVVACPRTRSCRSRGSRLAGPAASKLIAVRACCRAGSLYGELARFVLRLLGYRGKPQDQAQAAALGGPPGAPDKLPAPQQQQRERPARGALPGAPSGLPLPGAPAAASSGAPAWDNVWGSS